MTREEFLKLIGFGALAAASMYCLGGCSTSATAPQNVDFTLNITQSPYDDLQTVGKYVIKDGVIVAHISPGNYVALSAACTHEGTEVEYNSTKQLFVCPAHDSEFKTDGTVQKSPARKALTHYNVEVNQNIIRVYS